MSQNIINVPSMNSACCDSVLLGPYHLEALDLLPTHLNGCLAQGTISGRKKVARCS